MKRFEEVSSRLLQAEEVAAEVKFRETQKRLTWPTTSPRPYRLWHLQPGAHRVYLRRGKRERQTIPVHRAQHLPDAGPSSLERLERFTCCCVHRHKRLIPPVVTQPRWAALHFFLSSELLWKSTNIHHPLVHLETWNTLELSVRYPHVFKSRSCINVVHFLC